MNLFSQCNEKVTVERQDGARHENVPALVTNDMILVPDSAVPIAPNDVILRELPGSLGERLVVTEPGFHAKFHAIPAHYQVNYRHEGQEPAGRPAYLLHVSGENARLNITST